MIQEKLTKKQMTQLQKSLKSNRNLHNQRGQLSKSRNELVRSLLQESPELNKMPDERKPLPQPLYKALQKYHDANAEILSKIPHTQSSSSGASKKTGHQNPNPPNNKYEYFQYFREDMPFRHEDYNILTDFFETKTIDQNNFHEGPHNGYAGASHTGHKRAYGYAGTAALRSNNVHWWNRSIFGFYSFFTLDGTGKEINLQIDTHAHVVYIWLEALSFGKAAWGEVSVSSIVDIIVSDIETGSESNYWDSIPLIHGVSPRGNWREGDIGIWHPSESPDDANHRFNFTVTIPDGRSNLVTIFETIELIAERHHPWRTDRCNAVVQVSCTFDPVIVHIRKV